LHSSKTHPSDVVFYYDEPYSPERAYINCDLKSYGTGSINTNSVKSAIESLARALTCAEKSEEWRTNYIHNHVSAKIYGLLFVYNHDGEYDKDFNKHLDAIQHEKLNIPKKSKIVVLGPKEIFWLNNVRNEIVQMRGTKELPDSEYCKYFYPHLTLKKKIHFDQAKAATLEMLTAPWIILSYNNPKIQNHKGFIIFYKRRGDSTEEFLYLIDYLMYYQILDEGTDIQIKSLDPHPSSAAHFNKAIDQYIDEIHGTEETIKILTSIKYSQINQVQTKFSAIEIGMENV